MIQVQRKYVRMVNTFEKNQVWFLEYLASQILQKEQFFPTFVVITLGCAVKMQLLLWFYTLLLSVMLVCVEQSWHGFWIIASYVKYAYTGQMP